MADLHELAQQARQEMHPVRTYIGRSDEGAECWSWVGYIIVQPPGVKSKIHK